MTKRGENKSRPAGTRKSKRNPSPLEYRLQILWRATLRNARVGLDDNFFMMGGDSLKAVELFLQIERMFKRRLPVATLFKAGSVAEMARLLGDIEPQGVIIPIRTEGSRPPFFCVHAATGQAIFLHQLSQHLSNDQPIFGMQSIGWESTTVPFTKLSDMAAHYVAEIRKVQPHGPYFIGGYSCGGQIAIRMAQILSAAGEEVAFLVLFDTLSQDSRQVVPLGLWLKKQGFPTGIRLLKMVSRYVRHRLKRRCVRSYEWALRMVLFPVLEHYRASGKPLPLFLCRPDRCNDLMQFDLSHIPSYDGDTVYFKAESDPRSINHPDRQDAWHQIVKGKLKYIPASGRHLQMMGAPHIQSLASNLTREMDRALAKVKPKGKAVNA
jgi:thioesterase domain-containing protein/acyl carrier protein